MRVVLVHGLERTRLSLALLARRLSMSGHTPESFPYSALAETHDRIVSRLVARLRRLAAQREEVGLVGHSFGGLLLREALAVVPELRVKHLLMLATPNRQPRLAVRLYTRFRFAFFEAVAVSVSPIRHGSAHCPGSQSRTPSSQALEVG